jgi:uncharacterized protein
MSIQTWVMGPAGAEYVISFRAAPDPTSAPVLVVLDADDQFQDALAAAQELEQQDGGAQISLVGIGYGGGYRSPKNRRVLDYAPSRQPDEPMASGGAEQFHRFLETALIPDLVSRAGIPTRDIGIAGHSLGSLFGLYALCRPSPLFKYYLLSSPSVWWDDRTILSNYRQTAATSAPQPIEVFLSIGDEDTPSMTTDFRMLEELWCEAPRANVRMEIRHFASRDHYNVLPDAYREGFRHLYGSRG